MKRAKQLVDSELLEAVAKMRTAALRKGPFVQKNKKAFAAAVTAGCAARLEQAAKSGVLDVCYRKGKVSACLTLIYDKSLIPGHTIPQISIDYLPRRADALRDAKILLLRHKSDFSKEAVCFSLVGYPKLKALLEKNDFATDQVILEGPVTKGLKRLVTKLKPPRDLKHLGLTIRRVQPQDVVSVSKLFKQEFSRNPQFGHWGHDAKFLAKMRLRLKEEIGTRAFDGFVICRKKVVVGYFCCRYFKEGPIYPALGAVEIVLDQTIQKQGVAKTCYRLMLERAAKRNVVFIRGATSQPAVMGIGRVLGRKPFAYLMRHRSKYFTPGHFKASKRGRFKNSK